MRHRKLVISMFVTLLLMTTMVSAQTTREQYIDKYSSIAIQHQQKYGIPASIKMAQALLESGNGNSDLAKDANNHFGIKCKSDWTGKRSYHDDDAKGECFRKYNSVTDSFTDHSEFLSEGQRYRFLFSIPIDDYKSWAHGLKQAGYATNPQYAELLIKIIEDNNLDDLAGRRKVKAAPIIPMAAPVVNVSGLNDYIVMDKMLGGHHIYINNSTRFVVMFEGESLESLSKELGISVKRLKKYNDLSDGETLYPNDMVYIKNKRRRAKNGSRYHVVKRGETLYSISQLYAIRLKNLCEVNKKSATMEVSEGMRIRLK